jgi:ABC-type uncharacterized transport system auxiliary subunit
MASHRWAPLRAARRALLFTPLCVVLGACGSLSLLPERTAQTYYRFDDASPHPAPRAQPLAHSIVIAPISSNAVGNAYGMLYSRAPGERAYYQYNEWTDRPTLRVAQLLLERLDARHAFAGVAQVGSGAAGDVLVNVVVDDVVHDLSGGGGGVGRLTVVMEIIDRHERRMLGRRTFVDSSPAQSANAAGGAGAINRALTTFLDAASPWIETIVESMGR